MTSTSDKNIAALYKNGKSGSTTTDDKEICRVVRDHYERLATPQRRDHFDEDFHRNVLAELQSLQPQENPALDGPILLSEIAEARKKLYHGKAAGADGVVAEMLKCGKEATDQILLPLFHWCFENETVPDSGWCCANIISLFKSGDPRGMGNYRGISLHSPIRKLYCSILNTRAVKFLGAQQ